MPPGRLVKSPQVQSCAGKPHDREDDGAEASRSNDELPEKVRQLLQWYHLLSKKNYSISSSGASVLVKTASSPGLTMRLICVRISPGCIPCTEGIHTLRRAQALQDTSPCFIFALLVQLETRERNSSFVQIMYTIRSPYRF